MSASIEYPPDRPLVIIARGLQASGKTTEAKKWVDQNPLKNKRICKDDLRAMISPEQKYDPIAELFICAARNALILKALELGFNVFVDDTNLNPRHIQEITELVRGKWSAIEIRDFTHVSLEECIRRDRERPNPVGEEVIRSTYYKWLVEEQVSDH